MKLFLLRHAICLCCLLSALLPADGLRVVALAEGAPPLLSLSTLASGRSTANPVLNVAGIVTADSGVQSLTINGAGIPVGTDGSFSAPVVLAAGTTVITAVATDTLGNQTLDSRSIVFDQLLPTLTVTAPADNSTRNRNFVTVSGTIADPNATVAVTVNGGAPQAAVLNKTSFSGTINLAAGLNTLEITVTDLAGRQNSLKRTIISDPLHATVAVTLPVQDQETATAALSLSGTVTDAVTPVSVTISDGSAVYAPTVSSAGAFKQALTLTEAATYPLLVTVTENNGTVTSIQRNVLYTRGNVLKSAPSPTRLANLTVSGTREVGTTVSVTCPTAGAVGVVSYPTDTTWSCLLTGLIEGKNPLTVVFTSSVNPEMTATKTIIRDTVAPADGSLIAVGEFTQNLLSWSGFNDANSGIGSFRLFASTTGAPACSGVPLATCAAATRSYSHTGLTNGITWYYRICAVDLAGNLSAGATAATTPNYHELAITTPRTLPGVTVGSAYTLPLTGTGGVQPYGWALAEGALPAGLTLDAATGIISGIPTVAGNYTIILQIGDSQAPPALAGDSFTLAVLAQPLVISTAPPLAAGITGSPYSKLFSATGGVKPYTWSWQAGDVTAALPPGLTLNPATGALTGTPTVAGSYSLVIQARDSQGTPYTAAREYTLAIAAAHPVVTGFTPATGAVGSSVVIRGANLGNATVVTFNGVTATVTANTATYIIATVPAGAQSGPLTVTTAGGTAVTSGTFTVLPPKPTVTALTPGSGPVGTSVTITGTDFTNVSTVKFSAATALFAVDSPTQITAQVPVGATTGKVSVTTASGTGGSAVNFTIVPPPTITGFVPASGQEGSSVTIRGTNLGNATVVTFNGVAATVTANTASYLIATVPVGAGTGPVGVTTAAGSAVSAGVFTALPPKPAVTVLIPSSGAEGTSVIISGTDFSNVSAVSFNGTAATYTVDSFTQITAQVPVGATTGTVSVTTASGTGTSAGSFTVTPPLVIITTATLPTGITAVPYSQTLAASGGMLPYTWSQTAGALPEGLTLDSAGVISGTPSAAGTATFTVGVTDGGGLTAVQNLSVTVADPLLMTTTFPDAVSGAPYSQPLTASGGVPPYTWGLFSGNLPPGLTLNSNGSIDGLPTVAGTTFFTLAVADMGGQTLIQDFSLTVVDPLQLLTTSLPPGDFGQVYSQPLMAQGGTAPYVWSLVSGALPAGLILDSAGSINGTADASGVFPFTMALSDAGGQTVQQDLSITISAPLSVRTAALSPGALGVAYSQTLAASGGHPPYVWSLPSGVLPAGLTMNSSGVISGTPTAIGSVTFTAAVIDSAATTAVRAFTIVISGLPDLVVTSVSSANPIMLRGGSVSVVATVKNSGAAGAAASKVSFYLSADKVLSASDYLIGTAAVSALASGAGQSVTATAIPSGMPAGQYYLIAIADSSSVVIESKEGNNSLASASLITVQ